MPVLKNARHELFAQSVAGGMTQTAAAEKAGYRSARGNSTRLITKEEIRRRVAELKEIAARRVEKKLEVSIESVTRELARLGFSNVTDVIKIKNGKPRVSNTDELSEDVTAAISEIRQTKDGIVVKMHDKRAALVDLGRHMGYFKENVNLHIEVSLLDLVNASYPEQPAPKVIEGKVVEVEKDR
jgi:phage terminase small subunit